MTSVVTLVTTLGGGGHGPLPAPNWTGMLTRGVLHGS